MLFNQPPSHCTYLCVCLEIQSAKDFENDNLHVKYQIILPDHCALMDGQLSGSTHSSSKSLIDNMWLIGHCQEINILCTPNYQFEGELIDFENFMQWPAFASIFPFQLSTTENYL